MISNNDRSGWFGASDVMYIVGNWETKSFANWWMKKIGVDKSNYTNIAMLAGTYKEHQILNFINSGEKDLQIRIKKYRLRVNLDGNTGKKIHEVKTHREEKWKIPMNYIRQVQVQMYAFGTRSAEIVGYQMKDNDYRNFFLPIDERRISRNEIPYDDEFIQSVFLPRLKYLSKCMRNGTFPRKEEYESNG